MSKIRKLPAPRSKLGIIERAILAHNGKRDGSDKRIIKVQDEDSRDVYISPFMSFEMEKYFCLRDDALKYYILLLDCHNKDNELVICGEKELCKRRYCKKCCHCFSDAITMSNNEINNVINVLGVSDPKLIVEKENLLAELKKQSKPQQILLKTRTQINAINKLIAENEDAKVQRLVKLLNSKIRLIEEINRLLEAHFRIHILRLKHYWKAAQLKDSSLPPVLPSDDDLIGQCHQTFIGAFTDEYNNAIQQREQYTYMNKDNQER